MDHSKFSIIPVNFNSVDTLIRAQFNGEGIYQGVFTKYSNPGLNILRGLEKFENKLQKNTLDIIFLQTCL